MDDKIKKRFLSKFKQGNLSECWEWEGCLLWNGYGRFVILQHDYRAHRISYEHFIGPIPEGLCVCHTCDNPKCVNPAHLWLGTRTENDADRHKKGRTRTGCLRGDKHPSWGKHLSEETRTKLSKAKQKLTEAQVLEIRASTLSQYKLGVLYGISQQSIWAIKSGKTFRWIK